MEKKIYKDIGSFDRIAIGKSECSVGVEGVKFEFFAHVKNSKKICFLFQGAVDRSKRELPIFHRWSWSDDIDSSVIVINDPTLYLSNYLRIGWMFGEGDVDYKKLLNILIQKIVSIINIKEKDITFCGSSAGGFVALYMGSYYPEASCFVNNPQTSILEYKDKHKHVSEFLGCCLGSSSRENIQSKYLERLSIITRYRQEKMPRIIYYQNRFDTHHWEKHFIPFFNSFFTPQSHLNRIELHVYSNERLGHEPLPKSRFVKALNSSLI